MRCPQFLNNTDLGLLILRVSVGGMMLLGHGWGKLSSFGEKSASFPDPLGIGGQLSLTLATAAEFGCSILLIVGLFTRFATIPLICTMAVAHFVFHASDPWQVKELSAVYLGVFVAILFTGPGKYSVDARCCKTNVESA